MDPDDSETVSEFFLGANSDIEDETGGSEDTSTDSETDDEEWEDIQEHGETGDRSASIDEDSSQEVTPSPITQIRGRRPTTLLPLGNNTRRPNVPAPISWINGTTFVPNVADFVPNPLQFHPEFLLDREATPLEIMKYFWTDEIVSEICNESNRYCEKIKSTNSRALTNWSPMNPQDFWRFMALSSLMGIVKKSVIKDYWSQEELIATPIFSKVMPRDRYMDMLRCLHFVNEASVPRNNKDRFVKFGNVMKHILTKFEKFVNAGEFLCIDESLMPYKGRLSFKQYVPTKRARFGVKFFVLVDCETKAVLKLIPYQGKGTGLDPQFRQYGIGGSVVISLLKDDFTSKNHRVVADNWFATPGLVKFLSERQTFFLGTMQKRRSGDLKRQMVRKLKKGEVESFAKDQILVERWMDRREVCMINNFVEHEMMESVSSNPNNSRLKPKSVLLYNSKMGGVDDVDKVMKPQQSIRKSMKWYKKAFFHLWDYTIYNSFIGYKVLNSNSKRRFKVFVETFIQEVLQVYPTEPSKRGRPSTSLIVETRLVGSHFPQQVIGNSGVSKKNSCYFCKLVGVRSTTTFQCDKCGTWLCVKQQTSCFKKFHTFRRLPTH